MVDEAQPGGGSSPSICPWCSATYTGTPADCPSCGATLSGEGGGDPSLPGLTQIDAAAIVRAKTPVKNQRNRLLSWISGEYPEEVGAPGDAGALAPPDAEVRREILRLELEAEVANLQAEAGALRAEAVVEGHEPDVTAEDAQAAQTVADELAELSTGLDHTESELEGTAPAVAASAPPPPAPAPAPADDQGAAQV
jgi:hypothetical protein